MPGVQLWCLGDAKQSQSVRAVGLAAQRAIPGFALTTNHRQHDPDERAALTHYRAGDLTASRTIRTLHGWEHELAPQPRPATRSPALAPRMPTATAPNTSRCWW